MTEEGNKKCESIRIMTEEQRKCSKIIDSCCKNPIVCYPDIVRITISLAKVFNKDITEEEAIDIYKKFYKYISSNLCHSCHDTFERIANYFADGTTEELFSYSLSISPEKE